MRVRTFSRDAACLPLRGVLQLVVPEQLRASVLQAHVEGKVLGVAPPPDDPARQPPPLGEQPGLSHLNPRADLRLFGTHVFRPLWPLSADRLPERQVDLQHRLLPQAFVVEFVEKFRYLGLLVQPA